MEGWSAGGFYKSPSGGSAELVSGTLPCSGPELRFDAEITRSLRINDRKINANLTPS